MGDILMLVGLAVAAALLLRTITSRLWISVPAAAVIAVAAYLAIAVATDGYLDPFWPIAAMVAGGISLVVALTVALGFRFLRKRRREA